MLHPKWLLNLSIALGAIIIGCVILFVFSLRLYRQALKSDPGKAIELERELTELRLVLQNQKSETTTAAQNTAAQAPQPSAPVAAQVPPPIAQIPMSSKEDGLPMRFLPASIRQAGLSTQVPINLTEMRARWTGGKNLRIQFNIQYVKGDGGNQQGRILIIARGQSQVFVYPEGSINGESNGSVISEESGEHFSVSRFRGVLAQFGPFSSSKDIVYVDIFILTDSGEMLIHKTLSPKEITGGGAAAKTESQEEEE